MRRYPALLLAFCLAAGMVPAARAAAAPIDPLTTLGGSGAVENAPLEIVEIDPDTPTPEISLFRARTAAGPEFIRVPVKNGDPARIGGFTVTALPEGGGEGEQLVASGPPEASGDTYSYKLYFADPPQRDTKFTISVTPVVRDARIGFDLPVTRTSEYTYRAIQSLTIKAGGAAVGSQTIYLQTSGERQTVQLTADKNPASQSYAAEVLWSSSNPTVASVDPVTGVVTGNTGGTVTITAAVYDNPNAITASCTVTVIPISGIGLNPASKTLFTGGTAAETDFDLTATLTGDNGSTELVWENSNPSQVAMTKKSNNVYHLSASGKQPGSATITVTDKGGFYKATCTVTVVQVTGLTVSPASYTIYTQGAPQTVQLAATVTVSAGAAPAAVWTSDHPGIASVNAAGLVSAVAPGSATITAAVGGKSGSSTITVEDKIPVTSVTVSGTNSLTRTSDNLNPTAQLAAAVKPDNAHFRAVSWAKASGPAGITIDASGLVTATTGGTATFTATADGVTSAPYTVTVTDQKVTGITVVAKSVDKGDTVQMSATVSPSNAINKNVTWSLVSGSVATINAGGLVTGGVGSNGTVTVKATSADGSNVVGTGTVTVNGCEHTLSAGGYGGGAGTSSNPYKVSTADQLAHVSTHYKSTYFKQNANINLSGNWTPIGTAGGTGLSGGIYDGAGYSISGLSNTNYSLLGGLFYGIYGDATVQNVTLVSPQVIGAAIAGGIGKSTISNCTVTDAVIRTNYGIAALGGIAGYVDNSTIRSCKAVGRIEATHTSLTAGGIAGFNTNSTYVSCHSDVHYSLNASQGGTYGGIVGGTANSTSPMVMQNCKWTDPGWAVGRSAAYGGDFTPNTGSSYGNSQVSSIS